MHGLTGDHEDPAWQAPRPQIVWMPGSLRTEVHLGGDQTGGVFCLLIDEPPAAWSLPAHWHRNEAETIHIVEGEFEMEVDGERSLINAGQTIHVPRGVVHSSRNVGQRSGRRIVLFSPAGMEQFFLETGAPSPDAELDATAALASATRHGWVFV
jgi:mannose-6-phosphate isomerase-like protein (cupin superfamily)